MLGELDREWDRLCRRPATMRRVHRWTGDDAFERVVHCVGNLDELVEATQPSRTTQDSATPWSSSGDPVLCRLIELSATDQLAGRVVLQRILPGLISRSNRWTGRASVGDPTDIAIGAAWIAIRRYDTTTRHRHVAPALIADAMWIGFRRGSRKRVSTELPVPGSTMCTHAAPPRPIEPLAALAETIRAAARAGVPKRDLDLIRAIAVAGGPSRAAHACNVTPRTIRNRRDIATRRIRRALGPDWADWSDPLSHA